MMNDQNNDNQPTDIQTDLPLINERAEQVKAGEQRNTGGVGELSETTITKFVEKSTM